MNIEKVRKLEGILKGKKEMEGKWEVNVIEGALHGFAVRGDPTDEKQAQQVGHFPFAPFLDITSSRTRLRSLRRIVMKLTL